MLTLTKDAVTLYDVETNTVWRTMSVRQGEHEVQLCYGLGDTVQEYETTDLDGNPIRVVYQIDAPSEYRDPDQGGVYVIPLVSAENPQPEGNTVNELTRQQTQTGPIVWVLSSGEDYEGGHVLGVYASKDAAKGPFVEAAKKIPFELDKVWQDDDGVVNAHGGCDWVSLEPHPLITATQIA